jgi:beta-lactam-binding protein with PASTA domain
VAYVQSSSQSGAASRNSSTASFTAAQHAGNLNVVFIGWQGTVGNLLSVVDSVGNTYTRINAVAYGTSEAQVAYYARDIVGAAAGKNTVTATFNMKVGNPDLRMVEYGGLDPTRPLDAAGGQASTAALTSSGAVATTNANDLLVASNYSQQSVLSPGSGYTLRLKDQYAQVLEDAVVTTTGNYTATAPQKASGWYVMQLVAFRAAAAPPVIVANVTGQTQAAATSALTSLGLAVGTTTPQSSLTVAAGYVISESPTAGSSVTAGSTVNLVVSSGPASVSVPIVIGQTQAAASSAFTAAGLVVGSVTLQSSVTVAAGNVVSESPVAGTIVAAGSKVNLVVSSGPASVSIPNVIGQTQAAASSAFTAAGLVVGTVTLQSSVTLAAGAVISESPVAGTNVAVGSKVNLVISSGPAPVLVPNVSGQTQAAAGSVITSVGLLVGAVTQQNSAAVAAGNVISQSPSAGTSVTPGSNISLVISSGPAPVLVPNIVGQTQAAAGSAISSVGLIVGTVTQQSSSAAAGNVISESPSAGTSVPAGSSISLVISSGPAPTSVPNVIGQTQAAASSAISSAGLVVGTVSQQNSSAAAGTIISESPTAGSSVASGSAVNLVVSSGLAAVTVPSVVGQTQAAARSAILSAGLIVGTVTQQSSSSVANGNVISQSPTAGSSVGPGSSVNLVVSSGPTAVSVPNVVGLTQAAATSAINASGLALGTVTQQSSATITAGTVISESPTAGSNVASGSSVNLVVSSGAPGITVPSVIGQTQAAASSAIVSAGLVVGTVTQQSSSSVAAGNVISESPTAGTSVVSGAPVNLVVSTGAPSVTVPNVVGQTQAAASSAIVSAGLVVGTVTQQSSSSVAAGNVISEAPSGGTSVASGAPVNLVVSSGAPSVTVPNVVGQTQAAASSVIMASGLAVGAVTPQSSATIAAGIVISESPIAGTSVASGALVGLVVSSGAPAVTIPNVVGLTQTAASAAIIGAGLSVGTITQQSSATVTAGNAISESPSAGTSVASGSPVNLTVSSGPSTTTSSPYPQSSILSGISWDETSKQRYASGSDIWDSMWASDDLIYGVWGDGNGFTSQAKKQIGVSSLTGSPAGGPLVGTDVYLGSPSPRAGGCGQKSTVGGKPHGVVALPNAVMYMFHSTFDLCTSTAWLARSTNNGVTWTDNVGAVWPDANGFGPVAVLQYGAAQFGDLMPDNTFIPYIYIYGNMTTNPGSQYLARVAAFPSNSIETVSNWSYYSGPDASGNPTWAASSAQAVPVWRDPNYAESLAVSFNPALGRYIAYNDHGNACAGSPCERQVSLFDGPSPWGPWTTFDYEEQFDNVNCGNNCLGSQEAVGWAMMQKWFSADGLTIWVEYSSVSAYDSLNLIKGTISLATGSAITNLSISTGTPAVVDQLSLTDPGNIEFIDSTARLTSIPLSYLGTKMIRLARNDAAVDDQNYVSFTTTVAQNVCVAWDSANAPPAWLLGWNATGQSLIGDATFNVYSMPFAAGTVTLPGPGSSDGYILFVGCN